MTNIITTFNYTRSERSQHKDSVDMFGVNIGRRSINRAVSICSNTSTVQVFRKHPSEHSFGRNTDDSDKNVSANILSRTFSIHILEKNIDEDEEVFVTTSGTPTYKTTPVAPVEEALADPNHPRFGRANYSTTISSNLIADNNPFSWAQLGSQVAGHGLDEDMRLNNVPSILITSEGQILKPVQMPQGQQPRGLTEVAFYSHITHSNDNTDKKIRECIPRFFGIEQFESDVEWDNNIRNFLVLEDITQGYKLPAVMDVKIGRKNYGPDASKEKRARCDRKNLGTRPPLGYSVSGILSHSLKPEDEGKNDMAGRQYSKNGFGKKLTTDTVWKVPEAFYDLLNSGKVEIVNDVFLRKLEQMLKVFEAQSRYHIYGSSLLLAYDADAVRKFRNGKLHADALEQFINVKLIDFANVYESNGEKDDNFLDGFKNFLALLKSFSESESSLA